MAQLQSTSITGSLIVTQGITGSFSGSITNATSASYAATASYALNAGDSVWTGSAGNIYYNGGHVGIGTSSPYSKLEVTSTNVSWGEGIIINPASSGYEAIFFRAEGTAGSTYTDTWAVGKNASSQSGGELLQVVKNGLTGGTGYRVDALQQWKTNGDSIFGFNVGIGITNPGYRLEVNGDTGGSPVNIARFTAGGAGGGTRGLTMYSDGIQFKLQVTDNVGNYGTWAFLNLNPDGGNVGIGTTSPTDKLQVAGGVAASYFTGQYFEYKPGGVETFVVGKVSYNVFDGNQLGLATFTSIPIEFATANTKRMIITSGGNIGIGTTAPLFNLQVGANAGTVATTTIRLQNSYLDTNGYYGFNIDAVDNGVNGHDLRFLGRTSPTSGFSELVRIKNGGNVGIGTTSPESIVHIAQTNSGGKTILYIDNNAGSALNNEATIKFSVDSGASVSNGGAEISTINVNASNGNADLTFKTFNASTGFTEKLRITNNGNVGIGTSNPTSLLELLDSDGQKLQLDGNEIYHVNDSPLYLKSSGDIVFQPDATTYVTFKETGNVGIGTTSPATKFHLYESTAADVIFRMTPASGSYDPLIQLTGQGNDITTEGFEVWYDNDIGDVHLSTTYSNDAASIHFHTRTGASKSTSNERLTILGGGNVGIGTTSPAAKLQVAGEIRASLGSTYGYVSLQTGGATVQGYVEWFKPGPTRVGYMGYNDGNSANNLGLNLESSANFVINGGNVGIGTTSPSQKLHLYGSGNQLIFIENTGTYHMYTGLSSNVGIVGSNNATPLSLQTNGVSRVYLDTSGNVGIGTTSPSALLHVSQPSANTVLRLGNNSNYDQFIYFNGGNDWSLGMDYSNSNAFVLSNYSALGTNDRFVVTTVGNVGIGVTAPAAKLQISGSSNVLNVRGSGSATTSSIFSVDGNNGRLFEVSDDLSNSLFSVNTIAGLPVIEAFADYTVTMGTYGAYTLQVTGSRVGVGTSSPGYPLHVSGSVSGISIYATNDIAAFSDQSVKTDLQVIDSAVDRIKQINGYTYVRVDDLSNTRRAGVIAQEVQKVLPEVVSENQDGTLNVAYQNMIALLIEGMKEQQSQIDKLREDLEDLRYEL